MRASILVGDPTTAEELRSCLKRHNVAMPPARRREQSVRSWVEEVRSERPDLVFVDPDALGVNLESVVAVVSAAAPRATVAVVARSLEPGLIVEALRAGARDYVVPPLEDNVSGLVKRKRLVC